MNFLDFINKKQETEKQLIKLNEGFNGKTVDKALDLITNLFKKNITNKVLRLNGINYTEVDGKPCVSITYLTYKKGNMLDQAFMLNFLNSGKTNEIYSISIFDNPNIAFKTKEQAKITIFTMGASIVYFMPLIYHIINNKDYNVGKKEFDKYSKNIFVKESQFRPFYIGALEYHVYENLDDDYIYEQFINEVSDDLKNKKKKLRDEMIDAQDKYRQTKNKSDKEEFKNLQADYYNIVKAIKGGAENIEDIDIAFKSNVTIKILQSSSEKKAEAEIEKVKKVDPDVQWKQMRKYVDMVIKGINPSVILTGAPGLGKTYKVKKQLKAHGYVEGTNLCTIKGKCSPRQLYLSLYEYQDKGDIIVIDDADSLVGPHAPEDVINILKAALDSTEDDEGRLVSYMISGKLVDNEGNPIPKKFYYRGGVIVITNYNAGQIDTAVKGRSYVKDLNFDTEDILKIIERLMPTLGDGNWSNASKEKAFKYITNLANNKNSNIELSIRTFGICAKIYESAIDDDDFSDEECDDMIKDLLELQARRGGRKY